MSEYAKLSEQDSLDFERSLIGALMLVLTHPYSEEAHRMADQNIAKAVRVVLAYENVNPAFIADAKKAIQGLVDDPSVSECGWYTECQDVLQEIESYGVTVH